VRLYETRTTWPKQWESSVLIIERRDRRGGEAGQLVIDDDVRATGWRLALAITAPRKALPAGNGGADDQGTALRRR
jgi:hypothetical protein